MYHPDADPKSNCLMADFLPTSLMIFSINDFASSSVFSKSKLSDVDGISSFLNTTDNSNVIFRTNVCFYSTIIVDNYLCYKI